jgi:hypothetical protein
MKERHLKAQAKRLFHARFQANPYGRRTKQEAVADVITAWSVLGTSVIEDLWEICTEQIAPLLHNPSSEQICDDRMRPSTNHDG